MPKFPEQLFDRWGACVARRRRWVLLVVAVLSAACLPGAWQTLKHLDANIFNQVSDELPRFRALRETSEDFGGDFLVAAITLSEDAKEDPARVRELRTFGELFAAELAQAGRAPGDAETLSPEAPPVLREGPWLRQVACRQGDDLRTALQEIAKAHPHAVLKPAEIERLRALFAPETLRTRMKEIRAELPTYDPQGLEYRKLLADPLHMAEQAREALASRMKEHRQGFGTTDPEGYFISPDRSMLLILARPVQSAHEIAFDKALLAACQRAENRALQAFRQRVPAPALSTALKGETYGELAPGEDSAADLRVGFTGLHAISTENEASLRWDILLNTATAGLFVVAIYLLAYRRTRLALHIILTLGLAVLLTLGVTGPLHGPIGVLGAGFTSILIGMGEDYAVYLHNTFHTLRTEQGLAPEAALRLTLVRCGPSILAAAATAGVAFFTIATTHFRGLAELGLLAGLGLTFSGVLMLSLFPALLVNATGPGATGVQAPVSSMLLWLARLQATPRGRRISLGAALAVVLAVTGLLLQGSAPGSDTLLGVRFDGDFSNLRSLRIQAIPLRDQILKRFGLGFADLRIVVEAADERTAYQASAEVTRRLSEAVRNNELVVSGGVLDLVPAPAEQERTLQALKQLDLHARAQAFLEAARDEFGAKAEKHFKPFLDTLSEEAARIEAAQTLTVEEILSGPLASLLAPFARQDGTGDGQRVRLVSYYFPTRLDYPSAWYDGIADALMKEPPPGSQVRVTAARMVGFELQTYLFRDLALITAFVALAVAALLFLTYRSVSRALLAALPLIFGCLFVLAGVQLAQAAGWEFSLNYVNLMVFPLLLGTGIDYGIYMVSDAFSARRPSLAVLVSETGLSVFVACLTTLAGFGSMVFSNYTGLVSFGWACLLGYTGALFGSLVALPAVMGMLGVGVREGAARTGGPPATPVE